MQFINFITSETSWPQTNKTRMKYLQKGYLLSQVQPISQPKSSCDKNIYVFVWKSYVDNYMHM